MPLNVNLFPLPRDIALTASLTNVVSKPLEKLRFSTYADQNSVVTNYFESSNINTDDNLFIEDESINYLFNDRQLFDEQDYKEFNSNEYFSECRDLIFTHVSGINKNSERIPLFYKHKTLSDKTIVSATISLITNSSEEDEINYGFDVLDSNVYFNYKNYFNNKTGEYKIYFVHLTFNDNTTQQEIINPVKAIELGTYENQDQLTYTSKRVANGYHYSLHMPKGKTKAEVFCRKNKESFFYVKKLQSNSIYLKKPTYREVDNEWHVEIVAGEVYNITDEGIFRYTVPEFKQQPFSIQAPNLKLYSKDCFRVSDKIIKLPVDNISYDNDKFNIEIQTYDLDLKSLDDDYTISCVDQQSGFVVLNESLPLNEDIIIKADFFYKTNTFYYTGKNFNPYQNSEVLNKKFSFYIKPNEEVESIKVDPDPSEIQDSWMFLGSVGFEENYNLEDSFSFQIENQSRFISYEEALKKNPYILQSIYGYGNAGQVIQKENIVFLELPKSFLTSEDYTKEELYSLFKRKLKPSTNLVLLFTFLESKISIDSYTAGATDISFSWEGPGTYKIYRRSSNENSPGDVIYSQQIDTPTLDNGYHETYTDTTTENNTKYYYKISYNGELGTREYGVKCYAS